MTGERYFYYVVGGALGGGMVYGILLYAVVWVCLYFTQNAMLLRIFHSNA